MPSLARITNTFFVELINRLGIRPPFPEGFEMTNVVQPVSIVDSNIVLTATTTTQKLDAVFTAGEQAAPAAGTVLADTLAQAAGNYLATVWVGLDAGNLGGGVDVRVQRRDAANAVSIWSQQFCCVNVGGNALILQAFIRLEVNERLRLITKTNSSAALGVQGSIFLTAI